MDKQEKKPNLFDQALVIAMKEGKLQFSKDADPFQSGVVGENYLLFSKQRKLILSIPLEKLKRNTRKVSNSFKSQGCLTISLFGIAYLAFCFVTAWPKFYVSGMNERAASAAARNMLATIAKECKGKIPYIRTGTFIVPELRGYKPKKKNIAGFYLGINRKLSGTSIDCPTTGEMKVVSEDESEYPTFSYNFGTDKKTCFAALGSDAEKRGCFNGRW
ncbi:hypothetical protein [Prochlorococcus marinus]|uniref:hypothetical protein n=1 Tax=Prochlorococcus marinus TaxID=1219 RepID=UPI0022B39543|nr:hypothetical protein [Prochlorococcus marinus]